MASYVVDLRTVLNRLQKQTTAVKNKQNKKNPTQTLLSKYRKSGEKKIKMCMHDWFQVMVCYFFVGALLEFQSCELLMSVGHLSRQIMSTNDVHME